MTETAIEQLDVLVVGAGISGIGMGRYMRTEQPAKQFAILEARGACGGTWDLFRYPGIRSDSDLHTFGYEFKPWRDKESIAGAPRILAYLHETVAEYELDRDIRYHRKVLRADWSSSAARWLVDIEHTDTGERSRLSTRWIFCAGGYYRYDQGYTPSFVGRDRFSGRIVHPQTWPPDLDYTGKRVVVIGSGATAVTLIPAMAGTAEHVTMLQRTPTYVLPTPTVDVVANLLIGVFGARRGYALARRKNIAQQYWVWRLCRRFPKAARRLIRIANKRALPAGFPVDEHFNPPYDPWDQRLCVAPNGDLFTALSNGSASVVTERISAFTESGVLLESGRELSADIIVTATGLNLRLLAGIDLTVDSRPVAPADTVVYRGTMLSGVPNFAMAVGYTNASWTLKIGLLCKYFCRLLSYMDSSGFDAAWPTVDRRMPTRPLLDFGAGYVKRSLSDLPRQGLGKWAMSQDYRDDRKLPRDVRDEQLRFTRRNDGSFDDMAGGK